MAALAASTALAPAAAAFCGFYVSGADQKLFNDATVVVLMREDTRTVLSMQNNYQGPTESFAMVIPVPVVLQKENVKTLPQGLFDRIDQLAAPRLVEYWEQDPCRQELREEMGDMAVRKSRRAPASMPAPAGALGVKIEAQFEVGEYEIVILSAKDSTGLDTWLKQEKYNIPDGAEPVLRPYVEQGMKFFVAKVNAEKVKFDDGRVVLSPLRFHYDSKDFTLPVRLGLLNSNGTQDLIVHILAKGQRYEVSNYDNVRIPTNINVAETARDQFGEFYTSLFAQVVQKNPKSVVTEYAWDASSCDPCPTPALTPSELTTLGADVLPSTEKEKSETPTSPPLPPPPRQPGTVGRKDRMRPPRPFPMWRGGWRGGFVLTRLHVRYDKESLGDDLVFRAAPPIMGGREIERNGHLEKGSEPSSMNNFQARYAIRHPWKGAIDCPNPRRGVWGGPPSGESGSTAPQAAQDLGFQRRKKVELASFLRSDVDELGMKASIPSLPPPTPATPEPTEKPLAGSKCGACRVGSSTGTDSLFACFGLLAAIGLFLSRRHTKR